MRQRELSDPRRLLNINRFFSFWIDHRHLFSLRDQVGRDIHGLKICAEDNHGILDIVQAEVCLLYTSRCV